MPGIDYSRWDHLEEDDDEDDAPAPPDARQQRSRTSGAGIDYSRWDQLEEDAEEPELHGRAPAAPPAAPPDVMEDLEDYFQRLDQRLNEGERDEESEEAPGHVPRLTPDEFGELESGPWPLQSRYARLTRMLSRLPFASRLAPPEPQQECAICLSDFCNGSECVVLPCAARHVFHEACARDWLGRSVQCPLCRVDVRPMLRSRTPPASPEHARRVRSRSPSPGLDPMTPRTLGYTRDGGRIERYEPNPPPEVPRPAYIPRELHGSAQYVEISYEGMGTARVWRIPRDGLGEMPPADLDNPGMRGH